MTSQQTIKTGPIIQSVAETAYTTNMFTASACVLGTPLETAPSPENVGPPFLAVTDLPKGVSTTNSHYHPGYSFLMFPTGGYGLGDKFFPANSCLVTEPRAETGECYPHPDGTTELAFYESQWGGTPFFLDTTDPRSTQMMRDLGIVGDRFVESEGPGIIPGASEFLLDRDKDGIKTAGFTGYPAQVGPKAFGTIPTSSDPRPYAVLVEFNPGAIIPAHYHEGISVISIVDGTIEVCGQQQTSDVILKFPPNTEMSLVVGNEPARAVFFFDSGKAAIPVFADPTVEGAEAVQAVFGKA